jgi:hypothetical protein
MKTVDIAINHNSKLGFHIEDETTLSLVDEDNMFSFDNFFDIVKLFASGLRNKKKFVFIYNQQKIINVDTTGEEIEFKIAGYES